MPNKQPQPLPARSLPIRLIDMPNLFSTPMALEKFLQNMQALPQDQDVKRAIAEVKEIQKRQKALNLYPKG